MGKMQPLYTSSDKKVMCSWCGMRPVKKGYALCRSCYDLNEKDNMESDFRFLCPICHTNIGTRNICPKCGTVREYLISLPSHCHICHSQFLYKDGKGKYRCWMCNAPWEESYIDKYIYFALKHIDKFGEDIE